MILRTESEHEALLLRSKRVAVVGASPRPSRPSHDVFAYLRTSSLLDASPVNPSARNVDGVEAYEDLYAYARVVGKPDIVNIFRKPAETAQIVRDAISIGAGSVWFQLGVASDEAIALAEEAGLDVVVERCIKVACKRLLARAEA